VEAIPALSLALFGGELADRRDRRSIVIVTTLAMSACALTLAFISADASRTTLLAIFVAIFAVGVAGGFERPALSAFEAQVIPLDQAALGQSWASSVSQAGAICGPVLGGIAYAAIGVVGTYVLLAALLLGAAGCVALISRKPMPSRAQTGERTWRSALLGVRFVFRSPVLLGSMALDLFAVFFGGAVAMLPVFATDILNVGPIGLGLMRTAPSIGALLVMLVMTRRPPGARAGSTLLVCVAGFGVSMIVFALSRNLALSLVALFFSGVTDGASMVIRSVTVRVNSPEHIRARIAAVNYIFIGASNELGALESGVAARIFGVVPSVALGGLVTLGVVGIVALLVPPLRSLSLARPVEAAAA